MGPVVIAAALLVMAPLIMFDQAVEDGTGWIRFWEVFCLLLMIGTSILMNLYPIRYMHMGRLMSRNPSFGLISFLPLLFVLTPYFGHIAFLYLILYVFSPLITGRVDPETAARETPVQKVDSG